MNIQGGGIYFEVGGSNEKLEKVLEQSRKSISTFSNQALQGGKDLDKGFEKATQAIQTAFQKVDAVIDENINKINELKQQNKELEKQHGQAFMSGNDKAARELQQQIDQNKQIINARKHIIEQAQPIIQELTEGEKKLNEQYNQLKKNVEVTKSLRTQLREVREQLATMEENGQRGTEQFRKLQQEAGRLTNAIGDANTQARIFSHDNPMLQGTLSGITGLVGGFTAAQGALSLFVGENENLQKAMLKVQSLMSITMGLQQVMNTLNKDSAFRLTVVAKAKDMLSAANTRLAAALGISTAAANALMATLTLGLSVAIAAVIAVIQKLNAESSKAAEQQKKFNEETVKAAAGVLTAYTSLKTEWEGLTGSMKEREKWVQDNADRFKALGLKVYDAKTAEDVLIKNTSAFVQACMAKAKATAAQNLAAQKYEEALKKQMEVESMTDTVRQTRTDQYGGVSVYEVRNEAKEKAQKELKDLQKAAGDFMKMQIQFSNEERDFLQQLGDASKDVIAGSVEAAQQEISRLQALYNRAGTDTERSGLAKQIETWEKELSRIKLNGGNGGGSTDPYAEMLSKRKKLYADYAKWVQSEDANVRVAASKEFEGLLKEGSSYIDYLEKQRAAIEGKATKTAEDLRRLSVLNNEIAQHTKQTLLGDFEASLNRELEGCKTIGQQLDIIAKRRAELSRNNSEEDNGKAGILNNAEADLIKQAENETKELLRQYASYTTERLQFEESYARNRELLANMIHAKEIDTEDEYIKKLLEKKAAYEQYAKEVESDDKTIAASAKQRYASQLAEGSNFVEMLGNRIRELEDMQVKIGLDEEGLDRLEKLRRLLTSETTTDDQIAAAIQASATLEQERAEMSKRSDSKLYEELLKQYRSYEQQKADIKEKYDEQRNEAERHGNTAMLSEINAQEQAEVSKLAATQLMASESWTQLFSRLSTLSTKAISRLIEKIEKQKVTLSGEFNPADLKAIEDQLEKARNEVYQRNPFKALSDALKEYRKLSKDSTKDDEDKGKALKEIFKSTASSIDLVNGAFASVTGGLEQMGIVSDEETKAILNDLGTIMDSASKLANGIASANPLGIIEGAVGLITGFFDLFNFRDRRLQRSIEKHQEAIGRLSKSYAELEHAVDKALGESVYKNQGALIANLKQQQQEIRGMIEDEKSKKKTDWDKVEDWQEQLAQARREIEDIVDEITKSITQTSAGELAGNLADALVEAFGAGTSAAEAFGKVADNVLRNAVKNALKLQFLEKPLQDAIKQLQRDMGFDENGNGTFDGLTATEQARFKDAIAKAGANFSEALKVYEDLFEGINGSDASSLSGAIKGASQESIDLLAGQANAVRVNQVTSLAIFREQLQHLSSMDGNIGRIAAQLTQIINRLSSPADDGLRGQGITG